MNGWPEFISDCKESAKSYWSIREELCSFQEMILYNDRIVIPTSLRSEILERIHEGHQGRERCKRLARMAVYWPGMNTDIDNVVDRCAPCLSRRHAPPREPMIPHKVPSRSWEDIGMDIFKYAGRKCYLNDISYTNQCISDAYEKKLRQRKFLGKLFS